MFVIDGSDLVGKSTLQHRICEGIQNAGYPHMPMHLSRPPLSFDYYTGYLSLVSRYTVWDRFHLSSLAYRQHDDHACSMNPTKYEAVDNAILGVGGYILLVTADEDLIRERHAERGDALYSLEHILNVNKAFMDMRVPGTAVACRGLAYHPHIDARLHITKDTLPRMHDEVDRLVSQYLKVQRELSE